MTEGKEMKESLMFSEMVKIRLSTSWLKYLGTSYVRLSILTFLKSQTTLVFSENVHMPTYFCAF